jgi:serine/threonine protein kinase
MAPSDPLSLTGATVARRYAVESVVRVESNTVVYRATHIPSNRSVAIRVLAALSLLPESRREALGERLARDHAALAELSEIIPAAYPIRDVGTVRTAQGSVPFVVLDWPHGVSLQQMLQPGAAGTGPVLPEAMDEVVFLLEPVAVALAIAHEHGVVHGGLTAERILFREDGPDGVRRASLLDFGVASVLRAADSDHEATPADDVRALAALVAHVMARACGADAQGDDARTPRARGVVVNDEVEAVFSRALGAETYATVGDLWSALRKALGLAALRSLEITIPPETDAHTSTSLHPIARASAPIPPSRTVRDAVVYGLGAFTLLVTAGLTAERLILGHSPAPREAAVAPSARPSCAAGTVLAGGRVRLGDDADVDDPLRDVSLSPVCIDKGPVSMSAYAACSAHGDCPPAPTTNSWDGITAEDHEVLDAFCAARDLDADARPVNCISWDMAKTYCAMHGGRLPTEAESEAASRSTASSIAEWVSDWRGPLLKHVETDPVGPAAGEERVVRGAHALGARPTRFGATPVTRSHAIGFRCVTPLPSP